MLGLDVIFAGTDLRESALAAAHGPSE